MGPDTHLCTCTRYHLFLLLFFSWRLSKKWKKDGVFRGSLWTREHALGLCHRGHPWERENSGGTQGRTQHKN